jgi:2-polyprenyl-3-methyl-5-hydroxy-6-metoxy-1,4-benzoquinol methylase
MIVKGSEEYRRENEAKFFDRVARKKTAAQLGPIDPKVIARYRSPGRLWPKELCCRLAGNLAGLRILDVACGEGENSLLLASLGAKVTGIDISPAAIALRRSGPGSAVLRIRPTSPAHPWKRLHCRSGSST